MAAVQWGKSRGKLGDAAQRCEGSVGRGREGVRRRHGRNQAGDVGGEDLFQ